jgi:serine/threonine-protein kinase
VKAPAPPRSLLGIVLGDTYRIERQVAVGGMGELYEATHLRLSGRYAVKVLLPQFATYTEVLHRFAREAEIMSRLRHPNVVSILDFNQTPDGRAFLAMEFLEGRDLDAQLAVDGPMELSRVLAIVAQVVSSLVAAHAQGIVHRDLKPQNIFLTPLPGDGREMVKVLDFGISKVREARTKLTREHAIIGTPQYMAPEQALGHVNTIDHRADQFALSAITYELLAGREAFRAETVPAILYLVVHEAPPPLSALRPDLPAAVERVLLRALAKDPTDRFASIDAFGEALEAAALGRPPEPVRRPGSGRRERTPAALSAAVTRPHVRSGGRGAPPGEAREGGRPGTRPDRGNTTFGASTTELDRDVLATLNRPRRRLQLGAALLITGGLASAALVLARRRATEPEVAVVTAPAPARAAPGTPWPPSFKPARPLEPTGATGTLGAKAVGDPGAVTAGLPGAAAEAAEPTPSTAPIVIENPPPNLRMQVDGVRATLPAALPRREGQYLLHFESPGRRPQSIAVDGLATRHEVHLDMPRLRPRAPAEAPHQPAVEPTPAPAAELPRVPGPSEAPGGSTATPAAPAAGTTTSSPGPANGELLPPTEAAPPAATTPPAPATEAPAPSEPPGPTESTRPNGEPAPAEPPASPEPPKPPEPADKHVPLIDDI